MTDSQSPKERSTPKAAGKNTSSKHWYTIPEPLKRVFDQFPLVTYKRNLPPQRARQRTDTNTLYVFTNPLNTKGIDLSCNPTCLKWQVYLKFNDIEFSVAASNNHASPSGSLPFLLPARSSNEAHPPALTAGKLLRWTSQQVMQEEDSLSMEHEAYTALIDQNIRNAWLYHLYLDKSNFTGVAYPLYVSTASSNRFVQMAIAYQLREAAQAELLKSRHIIDRQDVFAAAAKALGALATLLGDKDFFSRDKRPSLFDASVFAYTHLLLDESLPWKDTSLSNMLQEHPRLVNHRNRLLETYMNS